MLSQFNVGSWRSGFFVFFFFFLLVHFVSFLCCDTSQEKLTQTLN